jgi:ATP-dependent DNA ligase
MIIDTHTFDILYGKSADNKTKSWKISVEKYDTFSEIVTLYGYNRKIETRRRVSSGKNLNKANATTHFQQAVLEATSKWTKKKDIEKYSPIKPNEITGVFPNETETLNIGNLNINDVQICLPMLAQDFQKQKKKVKFPAFCQKKLDGFRMIYNTTTKQITTRQGKEYSIIKESGKLYEELQKLPTGLILDGELYTNKLNFETLGVLRKTKKLSKEELDNLQKIEYHIYDIIDTKLVFDERNKKIKVLLYPNKYQKLIYVDTFLVKNEEEIKNYHLRFLEEGFEGTMIRNKDSLYKEKHRSSDLLKYKDFQDAEFKIIDYTLEKDTSGADENLIVWVIAVPLKIVLDGRTYELNNDEIQMENGRPFIKVKVRPQGTKQERKELYKKCVENFDQFKGRNLWTKFFSYTADGSLRFPSTKCNTFTEYLRDEII